MGTTVITLTRDRTEAVAVTPTIVLSVASVAKQNRIRTKTNAANNPATIEPERPARHYITESEYHV